jgi:hypothetical protein
MKKVSFNVFSFIVTTTMTTSSISGFLNPSPVCSRRIVATTSNYNINHQCLYAAIPRRDFHSGLLSGIVGGSALSWGPNTAGAAVEPAGRVAKQALVDVPMVRLKLPSGGFGREYVALQLKVQDKGPFDFMVDSGLTVEMISPHLQGILEIGEGKSRLSGLAAGGSTTSNPLVELDGAAIPGGASSSDLVLPKLTAAITPFPQEHIDPAHDVEGMLGMEMVRTSSVLNYDSALEKLNPSHFIDFIRTASVI